MLYSFIVLHRDVLRGTGEVLRGCGSDGLFVMMMMCGRTVVVGRVDMGSGGVSPVMPSLRDSFASLLSQGLVLDAAAPPGGNPCLVSLLNLHQTKHL